MTFDQLLTIVENSAPADWHHLPVSTVYDWDWGQEQGQNDLRPNLHSKLCIYRPNIDISLVMDAAINNTFAEPWVQRFSDPQASLVAVQLRYCGAIVHQCGSVFVDGGRYLLPLPQTDSKGKYHVPQDRLPVARLLFELYGVGGPICNVDGALVRAQIIVI